MGSLCCCFNVQEYEDPNSSNSTGNCIGPRRFIGNCINTYMALFQRGEVRAITSSVQAETSLTSISTEDNSLAEMFTPPPRPLPFDADSTCCDLRRERRVTRGEKGSSQSHEESEPLKRCDIVAAQDSLTVGGKLNGSSDERGSKGCAYKSLVKFQSAEMFSIVPYLDSSSEDEDVCPTCLEEYTDENPRITTRCSHHFHLGCIYDWQERSETCPVCGKLRDQRKGDQEKPVKTL